MPESRLAGTLLTNSRICWSWWWPFLPITFLNILVVNCQQTHSKTKIGPSIGACEIVLVPRIISGSRLSLLLRMAKGGILSHLLSPREVPFQPVYLHAHFWPGGQDVKALGQFCQCDKHISQAFGFFFKTRHNWSFLPYFWHHVGSAVFCACVSELLSLSFLLLHCNLEVCNKDNRLQSIQCSWLPSLHPSLRHLTGRLLIFWILL
jgi:hypothetical protein